MMRTVETKNRNNEDSQVRPGKMTVSKNKLSTRVNRMIVLILLAFGMFATAIPAFAQPTFNPTPNNTAASDIEKAYEERHLLMNEFRKADQVVDKRSVGPGSVVHSTSGPVLMWPTVIPTAVSPVPTLRDTAITKNMLQTFGYPVSDTQFQLISRMNDNIMLEQLYDPEKAHWMAAATGGSAANAAANSMASLAVNQALSAIDFCEQFLTNFTAEPNNVWQRIRDQLFVPMAILLLLPGAVLAQVKAIVAQGSPVLVGEIHPFDGLLRSIVAIFLIPGTFLVINYGIDVANSITYTIANEYLHIFGSDMYDDAKCAIVRAFPMNKPEWNRNSFGVKEVPRFEGTGNWAPLEGYTLVTARIDPCMGIEESRVPDEDVVQSKNINRLMMNGLSDSATITWNISCAFQMAFLYYLWCMGPIAAALWVWPVQALRSALASWVDGVITICFWSLFWNTTILLLACFRGVGDSGTIIVTALIFLAVQSVKSAFDFAGLASAAVSDAHAQAQKVASAAGKGGGGGGAGSGGGGSSGGASQGGRSGAGSSGASAVGGSGTGGDNNGGQQQQQPQPQGQGIGSSSGQPAGSGGADSNVGVSGDGSGSSQPLGDQMSAAMPASGSGGGAGDARGLEVSPPPNADASASGETATGQTSGGGDGGGGADSGAGADVGSAAAGALGAAASGSMQTPPTASSALEVTNRAEGGGSDSTLSISGSGGSSGGSSSGTGTGIGGGDSTQAVDLSSNSGNGALPPLAAAGMASSILGGNDVNNMSQGVLNFDAAQPSGNSGILGDSTSSPINLDLNNPANSLGGTFASAVQGNQSGIGADVFGGPGQQANSDAFLRDSSGQIATNADGKPVLDTAKIGDVPALTGNLANDPGAVSAQKTAADVMTMSGVTTDQLSRAMADPQGADYKSIADTVGVAPPVLDAALHGNTSAGVMTAVGFGGTETAAAFASPNIQNDTASMSIAANSQAQMIAGGDTGMLSRATVGMDSQAASQLLASPQMDAQFASTVGGYAQAREATGSYAQSDAQYSSMASYGGVAQGIAPNMISGELSPAGSIAQSNGFVAPVAAVSNDAGAISAHNAAADIMTMTGTSGAELQRALAQPSSPEYTQLAERFGAAPALVDAALHGSAAAAAVVETGFGRTEFARDNAATSFTAHQSVEMYNAAATSYGAPAVQSAAMEMNVGAGQQILQNSTLDNQFAATVSSYRESSLSGSYTQADTGYVTSAGATPAVTASLVTGGADAPGALAASMGYSAPYSVGSDPGAVSAQRSAADMMVMTNTSPETLQRALSNPSGAEYAQLSQSFGASPVLVDAALHGNASAAAIVETGFGGTQTAQQYAGSSSTAQQSVDMYATASTKYGEQTVQQAAQGDIGSAQTILQSNALDQQFASTVQSYQQAYSDSASSGAQPSFANVDYGSVTPSGAQPVVTAALVGGDPSPVGGYANAAGYAAPYALPSGDSSAVSAQRMGADIMAMTHTSPQELRAAIAHPESQQYQQLAERIGASPALVDSALHGNMSAAVVASAGFGTTETARQFESQSVTAAQSLQYSERAQDAAIASGAIGGGMSGAEVVRQAAIAMDPGAGQAILAGTGLASQFTSTVSAYQAEVSSGRGYIDAPSVPNVVTSSGQAQDLARGSAPVDSGYVGAAPVNYTASAGDIQPAQAGYTGAAPVNYTASAGDIQPAQAGYTGAAPVNYTGSAGDIQPGQTGYTGAAPVNYTGSAGDIQPGQTGYTGAAPVNYTGSAGDTQPGQTGYTGAAPVNYTASAGDTQPGQTGYTGAAPVNYTASAGDIQPAQAGYTGAAPVNYTASAGDIQPGQAGYTGAAPVNYTASAGDIQPGQAGYAGAAPTNYTYSAGDIQPTQVGYTGGQVVNDSGYSGGQPQYAAGQPQYTADQQQYRAEQPQYRADQAQYTADAGNRVIGQPQPQLSAEAGFRDLGQSQPQLSASADGGYREPIVNSGSTGHAEMASAAPWVGEVLPDTTSSHEHGHGHAQGDAYYQQQQQQQQQPGVVYGSDNQAPQQQARPNRLADALGGAAIAKIGGSGQKPTGGAPVAKQDGGGGSPPPQQAAVNKSLNPNVAKGRGKTQAELDEEQRRLLAEQRQNMPGNDGMA
ncbi:MAG: hypothetical protein Q8T09_15415 [Candidatus Melainabacteria bacterium]|nr:hypothetical protein [Candidatus Melainabacteria bacterium]